jgi:hypothetical protein
VHSNWIIYETCYLKEVDKIKLKKESQWLNLLNNFQKPLMKSQHQDLQLITFN